MWYFKSRARTNVCLVCLFHPLDNLENTWIGLIDRSKHSYHQWRNSFRFINESGVLCPEKCQPGDVSFSQVRYAANVSDSELRWQPWKTRSVIFPLDHDRRVSLAHVGRDTQIETMTSGGLLRGLGSRYYSNDQGSSTSYWNVMANLFVDHYVEFASFECCYHGCLHRAEHIQALLKCIF